MATRRIKFSVNNRYVQPLKLEFKGRHIVTLSNDYNSILTTTKHRAIQPSDYKVKAWMRFNSDSFDGVQLIAGLLKDKTFKSIGSCTFKIYGISVDDNWVETLLLTIPGVALPDGRFKAVASELALTPNDLTGELTYKLEIDITRVNKDYSEIYFFNHLGIYDSFIRLKQEVEFLDITKLDE